MKLYRSQLDQLISNKLFEISIKDLGLDKYQFINDQLQCSITIKSASNGYHIYGNISCKTLESCDRCLNTYKNKKKILLDIILSNNFELANNTDIIFFKDSEDFIDLGPVIYDLILLDSPLKQLCADNCKGLCSNCGKDLNKALCKCVKSNSDHQWDQLKKLTNK